MKRVLQPKLMRGRMAERFAILLFWGLLILLAVSMVHGVRTLAC
jgi:hypothetical protein